MKNISSINAVKIKIHEKEGGGRKEEGQKFVILTYKISKKK